MLTLSEKHLQDNTVSMLEDEIKALKIEIEKNSETMRQLKYYKKRCTHLKNQNTELYEKIKEINLNQNKGQKQ